MWTYEQSTGWLRNKEGKKFARGYSGYGIGRNNPIMQNVRNVGPIPRGHYIAGTPRDTETHGPYVIPLTPDPTNEMFGRSAFLVHGDSISAPGTASHGCIILPRMARQRIWESEDCCIHVVE